MPRGCQLQKSTALRRLCESTVDKGWTETFESKRRTSGVAETGTTANSARDTAPFRKRIAPALTWCNGKTPARTESLIDTGYAEMVHGYNLVAHRGEKTYGIQKRKLHGLLCLRAIQFQFTWRECDQGLLLLQHPSDVEGCGLIFSLCRCQGRSVRQMQYHGLHMWCCNADRLVAVSAS